MSIKLRVSIIILILVSFLSNLQAQFMQIDTLIFCGISVLAHKAKLCNENIQELSGIEYSGKENYYYVIPQSKKHAHIFLCQISISNRKTIVNFDSVIYLNYKSLEAESIRINPKDKHLYIAEERNGISYIHRVNKALALETVYTSTQKQHPNRGYEGLCFSTDGKIMYIGLERLKSGNKTNIIAYNLVEKREKTYTYNLDILPEDKHNDNGITELLTINDSTLLIVERAYLESKRNSIRVYKALIPKKGGKIKKIKLLTTFSASPKIDNIEGVSFSASGKELIFVSDNNSSSKQQTLFISMAIK